MCERECSSEVKKRMQAGWRKVLLMICDRRVSAKTKGKVYKMIVKPAKLFGLKMVGLIKKRGGRVGGSRVEDAVIFVGSNGNGQD